MKNELSVITFLVAGVIFVAAGAVFESKKSWENGHYTGPRNGTVLVLVFLALIAWFIFGVTIPNFGQDPNLTHIKTASPSLILGVGLFFIAILLKMKYLSKKQLL